MGVIISGILSIGLLRSNYEENVELNLIENATILQHLIESKDDLQDVFRFFNSLDQTIDTRMTLIDEEGVVLLDSAIDHTSLDNHGSRPEILTAYSGNIGVEKRYSDSLKKEMFYVAMPVDHEKVSVIRLSIPLRTLTEYTDRVVGNIFIAAASGVILATLLGVRFLNMFTGPLGKLTEATKRISHGDFGEQVYVSSDDEIGQLAGAFNTMSLELNNRINELKNSNMTNYAILKSMINGLIAIDNDYKIMFINKAAQEMFNIKEKKYIDADIREAFEGHVLSELFNKNFDIYDEVQNEFEISDPKYQVFRIYSNVIRDKERTQSSMGLLLNFVDISQSKQLENMRKEFVANVSHELKTPLTSIQGFIETLKEGAAEQKPLRDKFIDIIDIEANRLKQLIDDILILSSIERTANDYVLESVDPNEVINEISGMMEHIADKKSIKISYQLQEHMAYIMGNKVWMKQMMINLIDNAIKYTPEGGQVYVSIQDVMDHFIISVKDNGIGIDKEHLSRLFERFYRVDKARSKKAGGTGLGLAIVKHIALSMNGEISVESEVDKGTEFIIRIPKFRHT